jgi:L-amino acid N-acyltransferase YncA
MAADMLNLSGQITRLERADLTTVVRICNEAIAAGESTQGPEPVTVRQMSAQLFVVEQRFEAYAYRDSDGEVVGWAALSPHTNRPVYNVCAELEVFVQKKYRRRGIGRALAGRALERASALGYHALLLILQPVPTPPLAWAIRLGFRSVGLMSRVLPVADEWRDILVFELILPTEWRANDVP